MKLIPLTQGKFAKVDDAYFEYLSQYQWRYDKGYAITGQSRDGTWLNMSNLLVNTQKGEIVDHINGNTLDYQLHNLRTCLQIENHRNTKCEKNTTTGCKGITYNSSGRLRVRIRNNERKTILVGVFDNLEEAKRAYNKAAIENFGGFARLHKI